MPGPRPPHRPGGGARQRLPRRDERRDRRGRRNADRHRRPRPPCAARRLGKPLLAVLVTHAHPDHYGAIVELVGKRRRARRRNGRRRRRDPSRRCAQGGDPPAHVRDEWPRERMFPTRIVSDGDTVDLGGTSFTVLDLGPGESPHDSIWFLGDERRTVFLGDQIYDRHALPRRRLLRGVARPPRPSAAGAACRRDPPHRTRRPGRVGRFEEQRLYVETFVDAVRSADWSQPDNARAAVVERMTTLLPTDELRS